MPHAGLSAFVSHARRAVAAKADRSDGRLLADFLTSRDETAFVELVVRFGPMVFAVCRRLTGHHQDAEDAFQAAFVVLARKAGSIVPREAVGNWLYGVAVRVAKEARAVAAKRLARERPCARLPEPALPAPSPDDIGAVLDEELAALPDKFRTLLVLCDLRGEPQTEIAGRLGLPVGTVYSRLATARRLLADRLRKRGVALPATLGIFASAAVPARLAAETSTLGSPTSAPPPAVAALSKGVFQTMFLQRLTLASFVAVFGAACVLAAAVTKPAPPQQPVPPPTLAEVIALANRAEPLPPVAAPVTYKESMLVLVDRDGAAAVVFSDPVEEGKGVAYSFRYESADGKTMKTGTGKLFERRLDSGGYDPDGLWINAGPIKLNWSMGGPERGWIYYAPENMSVLVAYAKDFEDRVEDVFVDSKNPEIKKLDLKRFMKK